MATARKPPTATDIAPELHIGQLAQAKQQLDQEIEVLANSAQSLKIARIKFQESYDAIEKQRESKGSTQQLLVPLTGSMYVPGELESSEKFIIELGTGYYVERDYKSALEYFKRKTKFLDEQSENYFKMTQEKMNLRDSIIETIQIRQATDQAGSLAPGGAVAASKS